MRRLLAAALPDAHVTQRSGVHGPELGLPIPLMAATGTKACEERAGRIHAMLTPAKP